MPTPLLAANDPAYQQGVFWMNAGTLMVAVALLGPGATLLLHNPKDKPDPPAIRTTTRILGALLLAAGLALPLYSYFL